MARSLSQYALTLAANPNGGDDWLKAAYAHRQYFQPADYERAIKTAAYYAKHGYHADDQRLAKIQSENADLDWSNLDALEPSITVGDQPLRALFRARLTEPVELTIANIICDWFTSHNNGYSSLSYQFGWLRESMAVAVGLPKERGNGLFDAISSAIDEEDCMRGSASELREITALLKGEKELSEAVLERTKARLKELKEQILSRRRELAASKNKELAVEMARAKRVQRAFGYQLTAVPYSALLKVRRAAAEIVREKVGQEIDSE